MSSKKFKVNLRQSKQAPRKIVKKFVVGDFVEVAVGKCKGKRGVIQEVMPMEGKVVVQGVNVTTRRMKPTRKNMQAHTVEIERPIDSSNIFHIDPKAGVRTRVGYKFITQDGGSVLKLRYSKKSGELLDNNTVV